MLVCRELEFAPCLVACPSSDAADNIARRASGAELKLGRYGQKVPLDLRQLSTQLKAKDAVGEHDSKGKHESGMHLKQNSSVRRTWRVER